MVCPAGASTVAVIFSVTISSTSRFPIVQTPVVESKLPASTLYETNVNSVGKMWVTSTPVALDGPLFMASMVITIVSTSKGAVALTVSST